MDPSAAQVPGEANLDVPLVPEVDGSMVIESFNGLVIADPYKWGVCETQMTTLN